MTSPRRTDELAREWYLPISVSDRNYVLDIGYRCFDGRWLILARSASVLSIFLTGQRTSLLLSTRTKNSKARLFKISFLLLTIKQFQASCLRRNFWYASRRKSSVHGSFCVRFYATSCRFNDQSLHS